MNSLTHFTSCAIAVGAILYPNISLAEAPHISIQVSNCLLDGSGTPEICTVSNIQRIVLEVAFNPKGNTTLPRLADTAINPSGTMPANYLVVRVVDDQNGASLPVEAAISGAGESEGKQAAKVNLQIYEDSSVRQGKLQAFIDQAKAEDLASGAVSQMIVDEAKQKNSEILSAIQQIYVENRIGRFRLSVEYHSTQQGAWNGTVRSPEVTIDVVNKGSGISAFQNP